MGQHATGRVHAASWLLALSLPVMGCSAAQAPGAAGQPESATTAATSTVAAATAAAVADNISSVAAEQKFAVEHALGARCPGPEDRFNSDYLSTDLQDNVCVGRMPTHLARALAALPLDTLGVSREEREAAAGAPTRMRAIPGYGQRADFMFEFNGWIRSFEGPDPLTTIYLASGPYCQETEDECGALGSLRAYAVSTDGKALDVTAQVIPPEPKPTPAERKRYEEEYGVSAMLLDTTRLTEVPVMRLYMETDPDRVLPPSEPRSFGYAHFGFLVWTGTRFELRDKVPRSLWPCEPVLAGEPACSREPKGDRFVTPDR